MYLLAGLLFTFAHAAQRFTIADWREVQGLSQEQAVQLAGQAIDEDLGVWEDGESCGTGSFWGFGRQQDTNINGVQMIAIAGLVEGPHEQFGCSGQSIYDCRVVFHKSPQKNWEVKSTECEPTDIR